LDNSNIKCLERLKEITGKPDKILFIELDIKNQTAMDEQVFSKYTLKSVIHFAAFKAVGESVSKPLEYYNNNVCGTVTLLLLMKKYQVKCFIFSSSACVYGENSLCVE
jgi:UDP-glucose 4-epimerase